MTVRELDTRITSRELSEWRAYESVFGPIGPVRDDIYEALLLAMIHNTWAKKPKKPEAFLPVWDRHPTSPEEQLAKAKAWVQMFGGDDGEPDSGAVDQAGGGREGSQ